MVKKRVRASRLDNDEATIDSRGVVHFAVSLMDCARVPESVEIVWDEPCTPPHQCPALKAARLQIVMHPEKSYLTRDPSTHSGHFICEVIRCPLCEWEISGNRERQELW